MTERQKEIVTKYPMVKIYVNQILANRITIDDVKKPWRAYVEEYLAC